MAPIEIGQRPWQSLTTVPATCQIDFISKIRQIAQDFQIYH